MAIDLRAKLAAQRAAREAAMAAPAILSVEQKEPTNELVQEKEVQSLEPQQESTPVPASTNAPSDMGASFGPMVSGSVVPSAEVKETPMQKLMRLKQEMQYKNAQDKAIQDEAHEQYMEARKLVEEKIAETTTVDITLPQVIPDAPSIPQGKRNKDQITKDDLNGRQLEAVGLAEQLQPFCLIGSAGSGKTTTTRIISQTLYNTGELGELPESTKWLSSGSPAIVFVSFTNQAVTNIKGAVPEEFKKNCLTIHKLLEYEPIFFDILDPETQEPRKTMRYVPGRTMSNPIRGIKVCVVEESGNIPVDLFEKLEAALPRDTVYIFLGDLNQIPPVFGDAILGFKLLELPVVELTHTYRTDGDSPIRKLAYRILEGKPIPDKELAEFHTPGQLEIVKFKDRVDPEHAVVQMGKHLQQLIHKQEFNPDEDVILTPYNKSFGTIEINRYVAQTCSEIAKSPVFEIIAGFNKHYLAIGDIIYWNKNKWRISDINKNGNYGGKLPQPASLSLDRWGINHDHAEYQKLKAAQDSEEIEALFNQLAKSDANNTNAIRQASHIITLQDCNGVFPPTTISDSGDVNSIYFAYCLTIHKALGSEWKKVFMLFHHSQSRMINREIIYTGSTRAREFLRIYTYGELAGKRNAGAFQQGIINQAIPGTKLEEKLNYFRKKLRVVAIKQLGAMSKVTGKNIDLTSIPKEPKELVHFIEAAKKQFAELTGGMEFSEDDEEGVE